MPYRQARRSTRSEALTVRGTCCDNRENFSRSRSMICWKQNAWPKDTVLSQALHNLLPISSNLVYCCALSVSAKKPVHLMEMSPCTVLAIFGPVRQMAERFQSAHNSLFSLVWMKKKGLGLRLEPIPNGVNAQAKQPNVQRRSTSADKTDAARRWLRSPAHAHVRKSPAPLSTDFACLYFTLLRLWHDWWETGMVDNFDVSLSSSFIRKKKPY